MRDCQQCGLCCRMPISPDGAGMFSWCGHYEKFLKPEVEGHCRIYNRRPMQCRDFFCMWVKEELPEEFNPYQCGMIIFFQDDKFVMLWEWRLKKHWQGKIRDIIFWILANDKNILIVRPGSQYYLESKDFLSKGKKVLIALLTEQA
jgi:Fe-S-cluster containining protein